MTGSTVQGYEALTEKEKQTLRLLLEGYDAKSMARHLDLSVHTINERLRDARRKFAVSSSKEAARLLRRAEVDPETLGDRSLGDGKAMAAVHPPTVPGPVAPSWRSATWAIGGVAMLTVAAAILALTVPNGSSPAIQSTEGTPSAPAPASAAVVAARAWLELGDAGKWDEALAATGAAFRAANSPQRWRSVSQEVRVPLGRVRSRTLLDEQEVPTPPRGARIVRFRTDFEGKPGATETLSLQREGDAWKVVGIYLE